MENRQDILFGDCLDIMKNLPDNIIDLIITSPPYANQRKSTYGGIQEKDYVDWFLPISIEAKRILKSSGSFFLNIKPHTNKGERSLYVFDLVSRLKRDVGFLFVEEYCWVKNAFPTGTYGRFKNGFEPIYHFTKSNPSLITFNALACGTPITEVSRKRSFRKNSETPKNGSKMFVNRDNIKNIELARPSNVINVNNVTNQFSNKITHSAVFPEKLVEFFIKSFTNENDLVLDMFAVSGTTGVVCKKNNRQFILIDNQIDSVELMRTRLNFN
jgi:site-specific DNA-methyltransferase (adenine-specific)